MIQSISSNLNSLGNPQIFNNADSITVARGATGVIITITTSVTFSVSQTSGASSVATAALTAAGLSTSFGSGTSNTIVITGSVNTNFVLTGFTFNLRDGANANIGTEVINIESLYPTFVATQQACSYCAIYNPTEATTTATTTGIANRGIIEYFQDTTVDVSLGTASYNSDKLDCSCTGNSTRNIYAVLTIREIPNCGGTSPIVFQAIGSNVSVVIEEYKPQLNVDSSSDCCVTINNRITALITYSLNNIGTTGGVVSIKITEPDNTIVNQSITINEADNTQFLYNGSSSPASPLLTKLGIYKFEITVTNASCNAESAKVEKLINVCNSWVLAQDACKLIISNYNTTNLYYNIEYYDIKLGTWVLKTLTGETATSFGYQVNGTSNSLPVSKSFDFNDGLYRFIINPTSNSPKVYYFLFICKIKECKFKLLKSIVCDGDCPNDCEKAEFNKLLEKRNKFNHLYELLLNLFDNWRGIQNVTENFSVIDTFTPPVEDIVMISRLFTYFSKSCGVTIGEVVSDGCASIESTIINDCGCAD